MNDIALEPASSMTGPRRLRRLPRADRPRSVHDIVSHGWLGHEFDADGELSAWLAEDRMYSGASRPPIRRGGAPGGTVTR